MPQTNGKTPLPHDGLSPAAVKLGYRLMGLKEKTKYAIILTKLGNTWVYEIEEQRTKIECAQ
jgi:hypothetical protein